MLISILIPTIQRDARMLADLRFNLANQMAHERVNMQMEIIIDDAERDTVGMKRNRLLQRARGKYVCFFDADDWPSDTYIMRIVEAAHSHCDCASLRGVMTTNGKNPEVFEHSLKYSEWRTTTNEVKYERYPNHLNLIRADIARQFAFPEINHGEDHDWSKQIHEAGVLKTEYYIPETIYYYRYVTKKL